MTGSLRTQGAELLGEILGMSVDAHAGLSRKDCPSWDSLKHLEVVMGFEDEFEARFSSEQVASIGSLDDLVALVGAA